MDDLIKLLEVSTVTGKTEAMYEHIMEVGNRNGWLMQNDKLGNIYATKGMSESYPCVVAHTDTVHHIENGGIKAVVVEGNITGVNPLTMRQTGIGGDDKCGIWAAFHCMNALPYCKSAFFVDEESGCKGSRGCDLSFFDDCRFILQADRRGNSDFVTDIFGPLSSQDFLVAVDAIGGARGYKSSDGVSTDVAALRDRQVGISVANMSAGYHNPHRDSEYINIMDLLNVCAMMEEICLKVTDKFPFVYVRPPYVKPAVIASSNGYSHQPFPDHDPHRTDWEEFGLEECAYCGTLTRELDLMETDPNPVCIDCALVKEESGVYPVRTQGSFWRRLVDWEGKKGHQSGDLSRWNGKSRKEQRKERRANRKRFRFKTPKSESVQAHTLEVKVTPVEPTGPPAQVQQALPWKPTINGVSD